jgi:hypothetical protein
MHDILTALERVLFEERSAIKKLDTPAIDDAATRKIALEAKLGEAIGRGERASKEDHALLERIRSMARANQLLLVHARACVRGVVAIMTGKLPDAYPAAPATASASAMRVNVTG